MLVTLAGVGGHMGSGQVEAEVEVKTGGGRYKDAGPKIDKAGVWV